jgi:hypothetical protein
LLTLSRREGRDCFASARHPKAKAKGQSRDERQHHCMILTIALLVTRYLDTFDLQGIRRGIRPSDTSDLYRQSCSPIPDITFPDAIPSAPTSTNMPITTLPLEHLLTSADAADLPARRQLSDVSTRIVKSKKVVVVSGAGISCSSGIPVSGEDPHPRGGGAMKPPLCLA